MNPAIRIRAAVRSDAASLAEAQVQGWRVGYRGLMPDWYLDADSFAAGARRVWDNWTWSSSGRNALFVADVDDAAVGFGLIGPAREYPSGCGEVYAMYLHPSAWGSGAAAPLMAACVEWLAEQGWSEAVLWVLRDNPRARRFYEKTGWHPSGRAEVFRPPIEPDREPIEVDEVEYRIGLSDQGRSVAEFYAGGMTYKHAIVWLDHREAKIIDFNVEDSNITAVTNADDARRVNRKQNHQGAARQPDFTEFFNEVAEAFGTSTEVLITGPAEAKNEFRRHLDERYPKRAALVVGVETLDHPSDGQLLAFARKFFKRYDQVH